MNGVGPLNWGAENGRPRLIHWSPLNGVQYQSPMRSSRARGCSTEEQVRRCPERQFGEESQVEPEDEDDDEGDES